LPYLEKARDLPEQNLDDRQLLFNLALAYFGLGREEEAVSLLVELTRAEPSLPDAYRRLSMYYLTHKDLERAFEWIQEGTKRFPENEGIWAQFIHTGFEAGHDEEAARALEEFHIHFPESQLVQRRPAEELKGFLVHWRERETWAYQQYQEGKLPRLWLSR
jgi:tetratricopeptide (TPR) repeat protein